MDIQNGYGNIKQVKKYAHKVCKAAAAGNLELLGLAILKGYLFTSETMHNAIINGHYEMFRYLRKCGCPITYKDEKLRMIYFSSF